MNFEVLWLLYLQNFSLQNLAAWHLLMAPANNPQTYPPQKSYFLPIRESFSLYGIIGASLSEPHTSVTAFAEVVCMYVCLSVRGHIP